MKHYLALGLLSSLLLTSCSVDWNNEKEKKIGGLEINTAEVKNITSTGIILSGMHTGCGALMSNLEKKEVIKEFNLKNTLYSTYKIIANILSIILIGIVTYIGYLFWMG